MTIRTEQDALLNAVKKNTGSAIQPSGAILIDDTAAHTGPYFAITALEDAAVDISECDMSFITDVADFTIPKGLTIYGNFASIELDSGKVIAYSKSYSLQPKLTYNFSKFVEGDIWLNYSVSKTHTTGKKKETDIKNNQKYNT